MKQKKDCGKITIVIIILEFLVSSIGILSGFIWRANNNSVLWENLIYPKVKIATIDVSGKTKLEAINIIKNQYLSAFMSKKISVVGNDKTYVIEYSKLINNVNIEKIINEAINYGKDINLLEKNKIIRTGANQKFSITYSYDEDYLKSIISEIEKNFRKEPVNASIEKSSDGKLQFISSINGYKVDKVKLEQYIIDEINNEEVRDKFIKVPVEEVLPEITLDKISNIDTVISSFNTNFAGSSFSRVNNINRATELINGKIIMPGEQFSFNNSVGERTKERGFTEAPIISDRKIKSGLGGGICQVSSTLYNAVLKAGIEPTERKHHSLPSSYVGLGLDATVDWNSIDFKFKNNLTYPIFVESYTKDRKLFINIYSNSSLSNKKYAIINDVENSIKSKSGYSVKVFRNTYENEQLVGTELVSNDYYSNANMK